MTPSAGSFLLGTQRFIEQFAVQLTAALFIAFVALFLLLLFALVLRHERLGLVVVWVLLTVLNTLLGRVNPLMILFAALGPLLLLLVLYRYGLLAAISSLFLTHLWVFYPITTELTAWYATSFAISLAICVALVIYAFYTSLAGRPLFSGKLLQE